MNEYQNEMLIRKINLFGFVYGMVFTFAMGYWNLTNKTITGSNVFFLILLSSLFFLSFFYIIIKFFFIGLFSENNPRTFVYLGGLICLNVLLGIFASSMGGRGGILTLPPMYLAWLIACLVNLEMNLSSIIYIWVMRRRSFPKSK